MITVKSFSKLLAMNENEVRNYISRMKKEDAKELLIQLINFMNHQNREGSKSMM